MTRRTNVTALTVTVLCAAALIAIQASLARGAEPAAGSTTKPAAATQPASAAANPVVIIETNLGTFKAELWADKAPGTVANFLRYTDEKFFDGLVFHRVIPDFMIQGGGYTPNGKKRAGHEAIQNEAKPTVRNDRGTLAMARTNAPHSATSEFFINLKDNDFLNQKNQTTSGYGYCAFGKVIEGMDVVDKIAKVKCKPNEMGENASPVETVEIKSIRRQK